jgi:hypothetical protein
MCADAEDPMADEIFIRQVGQRRRSPGSSAAGLGQLPPAAARAAMTRMAQYRTRVPKGVYIYTSHEAANRDWERWRIDTMRANSRVPR